MDDLSVLLAEREIRQQLNNYCRAMDRCDAELGTAVFHPDSEVDYGPMFQGSGAGFVRFALSGHQHMETHAHRITNVSVHVTGEAAGTESYVDARFRMAHDGTTVEMSSCGRFVDQWEWHDGRWLIRGRRYLHGTDSTRVVDPPAFPTGGTRDVGDVSYEVLASRSSSAPHGIV